MSRPAWATVVASLVGIGLLVSFEQVVAQSVMQGELRHAAMAAHERTSWLCKRPNGSAGRDQCMAHMRQPAESMPSHSVASFAVNPEE